MKGLALILLMIATPVAAGPITIEGINFSDERGTSPS